MANYTSDEVQAAVEKIIRSTVRHPLGSLGERQVNTSFTDLQEAASGVYILYFNAPYYTLLLGTKRLLDALATQASTIESLIDAVAAIKRTVTPVNDLSNLANAKAALEELQSAVSARDTGFNNIQAVPAFRRYATNLDSFITTQGANIKSKDVLGISGGLTGGDGSQTPADENPDGQPDGSFGVVDTPSGARSRIPGLVSLLKQQQDELVRRAGLLAGAIEDFGELHLPQLAAQGVISRARAVLAQHFTDLSALDENSRLENLRAVVLDLLAQRPLVEKYGAGLAPSQYIATQGLARGYSDALHLATPALVEGTEAGPFPIVASDHFIRVAVDGAAPFDWPLPLGYVAELNGSLNEPFNLGTDSNRLVIVFDSPNAPSPFTRVVNFFTGSQSAAAIVAQFNAAMFGTDLVAEAYFRTLKFNSLMSVYSPLGGNSARFTVLGGGLTGLNVVVGDEVDLLSGPQAGTVWTVTAVDAGGAFVDTIGSAPALAVAEVSVQIGAPGKAVRLRDGDDHESLVLRRSIKLQATGGKEDLCAALLGFAPGLEVRSQPVMATDVALNINTSTSLFSAEILDTPDMFCQSYGDLIDATKITMSDFIGEGPITGGTTAMFTYDGDIPAATGKAVIRESDVLGDVGLVGTITANDVVNSVLTITFSAGVTAGTVTLEVGPDHIFKYGDPVLIVDGPNQGRYTVREDQGIGTSAPFEVLLDRALPVPKVGSTPSSFGVYIGYSLMVFKSPLKQITSSITIDNVPGTHAAEHFILNIELPLTGKGSTQYVQFDTYPKGAAVGDLVQLFEDQYNLVSRQFEITGTEPGSRILRMARSGGAGVEADFSLTFDQGVPNPFGAIRIAQTANYGTFKGLLDVWLERPELTTVFYRDLARFLNPVLTNSNPTSAAVDDAVNQLKSLYAILSLAGAAYTSNYEEYTLEYALSAYSSPVEPAVDALITTFRNKGADRAIDLLLEGDFSTFFGLDLNTVSYSGTLTQAARDVAMNDLAIRKTNRRDALSQQFIGTIPDQLDHEHEFSDADSAVPDIPGSPDVSGPGDAY